MSNKALFTGYLKELYAVAKQGDAREESFYHALADMLNLVAESGGKKQVRVTVLPTPTDAGNPDLRLWNGRDRVIGYVEAKKPTEERLDIIEDSEQLKRYRNTFPNLILTNFFEFRLYRNGDLLQSACIARPFVMTSLRIAPPVENPDELKDLLDRFLDFSLPKTFTAATLAVELAKRTRFLRDVVGQQLASEKDTPGVLTGFYKAFQTYLIGTLTPEDFADLFAQTITYGLFAARIRAGDDFNRRTAFDCIPHTIGVLRDLFRFLSLGDLPEQLAWCVDDVAEVLAVADASGILDRYYHEGKGSDPIVHFYETFLAQYDPAERERRGVYYTPEAVVGYIVRSLHGILKSDFGKRDGLASKGVTLLDPAAGTMTFIAHAAKLAVSEFETKYGKGGRADFIRQHILKNFYAFELMMAPYAVGHLKMSFLLEELGHKLTDDERVSFFLTNTLDMEELKESLFPFLSALAEESRLAGVVKKQTPVLVILGNPPYSGISTNMGKWIIGLIEDYKYVDGKHFGERKHWLQDDYVKFMRFAQWKIEQVGCGLVGIITNHGYLDNPTFRGMRQSLMKTFDDIYILNLHGNSLKKETCPDGSPDKNVFDIRQGVAIAFFIKRGENTESDALVRHAERFGTREDKYDWLDLHDQSGTNWQKLKPKSPFYFFVPRNMHDMEQYQAFVPIGDMFNVNVTGIVTARDKFVIDFDKNMLLRRIDQFRDSSLGDEFIKHAYKLKDTRGWKLSARRKDMAKLEDWRDNVVPCLYRPFDTRSLYYHPLMVDWGRPEVMRHMLAGENLALITARSNKSPKMDHFFCSDKIVETKCGESTVQSYTFPLYLYPTANRDDIFARHESFERTPNLNPTICSALKTAYGQAPTPEAIFHYIYAVLYAPTYRTKYAEFLKSDFPRIPFTTDYALFNKLAAIGEKLVALHLLKSPDLNTPACRFEGEGDSRIEKGRTTGLRYNTEEERVYINAEKYFAPVPAEVWNYQIGGYQVCEKWLKDRREQRLGLDDILTYCRIVTALGQTIALQKEIDALYPSIEEKLLTIT
ncbi:MAG: type ISP restriction/modification enzyme [bacterium]